MIYLRTEGQGFPRNGLYLFYYQFPTYLGQVISGVYLRVGRYLFEFRWNRPNGLPPRIHFEKDRHL